MKILIVDDNEINLMLLKEMIKVVFPDMKVSAFTNPYDVLSCNIQEYDMILSDIDMPTMDGFELFDKLKESGYKKPIIAITAFAVAGDEEKILMHGFDDYISKPINIQELQEKINNNLKES